MNKFLIDAGSNYLRMLTMIVCSLFLTRAMAIHLGIDDFGRWSLITSIFGLAMLLDLGLGNVVVKSAGTNDTHADATEILSAVFATFFVLSIGAFLVAVVAAKWMVPSAAGNSLSLAILFLGAKFTIATLPWSVFRSVLFARGGMVASNLVQSAVTVIYSVCAYVALLHGGSITTLAALTLGAAVVESSLLAYLVIRNYPETKIRLRFSFRALRPAMSLGSASLLINVAGLILLKTDPIIVKAFLPFSQVALYAVALRISENVFLLCKQLVNALTPRALQAAVSGKREVLGDLFRKATRYVFAFGVALYVPCFFLGQSAIGVWLSSEFAPSGQVLNILLAAMVLSLPQLVASNLMTFSGHHRVVAQMVVTGAIVNIVASVVLVQFVGMRGVAFGTLFATLVVDLGILVPTASRHFGFHWKEILKDLLKSSAIPAIAQAGFVLGMLSISNCTSLAALVTLGLASVLIFGAVFLLAGISSGERLEILRELGFSSKQATVSHAEITI